MRCYGVGVQGDMFKNELSVWVKLNYDLNSRANFVISSAKS